MEKMTAAKTITASSQRKITEKQQKSGPISDIYYDHSYNRP